MLVEKTTALIKSVKPGKKELEFITDLELAFGVPKEVADELFPGGDFLDQFFKGDDIRLECVYPIKYKKEVPFLRLKVDRGADNWMVFEPATILKGMQLTPQVGQFVEVVCKVRLYPTHKEAGHLDRSVKEHVVIEMEPLNVDIEETQAA